MKNNLSPEDIAIEIAEEIKEAEQANETSALTMDYLLTRIDKTLNDTEYIQSTLSALENISVTGPGDVANAQKADAICAIVKCRETTNQKLLALYEKMYEDIKPCQKTLGAVGEEALTMLESVNWDNLPEDVRKLAKMALINRL